MSVKVYRYPAVYVTTKRGKRVATCTGCEKQKEVPNGYNPEERFCGCKGEELERRYDYDETDDEKIRF